MNYGEVTVVSVLESSKNNPKLAIYVRYSPSKGIWLDSDLSTTNENLEERLRSRPPTLWQSRVCVTRCHVFASMTLRASLFFPYKHFLIFNPVLRLQSFLNLQCILMDVIWFLTFLSTAIKGGNGKCIKIMGRLRKSARRNRKGRKVRGLIGNICIVHALLCKVLPDNCTCVNTSNADFVLNTKADMD